MCGICGQFHFHSAPADTRSVDAMLPKLARRGPDDGGQYANGPAALGHRRLSILDLSERAHQPMQDTESGLALVFNGTIYNHGPLREQLKGRGHSFRSSGDTEVILRAYLEWGEHCVDHLHGMFAFAIFDPREQSLFLARDRLGIKPLYYSLTNGWIRFASNSMALLAAGDVDTRLDTVALHHQFTLHGVVPAPRTVLRGVRKLPPATTMTLHSDGRSQQRCYWQLRARRNSPILTGREAVEATHEALKKAVRLRIENSDVPVGVLLSGGLDSSLLVALLAEQNVADLRTFSIGFEDTPEEAGSEFEYSDQVVDRYQTNHQRIHIPNDHVLERLPEAVGQMAEPMFAQDAVAFYLLGEQVSKSVKVVQSGQGADEVFGGYFWYPKMAQGSGDPLQRFAGHYFDRDHDEYLDMVDAHFQGPDYTGALVRERLDGVDADEYMDRVLHLDTTMLIVDDPVKRVDNMTMAWGLEARVPFLDHELVELAASIAPDVKLADGGKSLLKSVSRGLLPDAVIDRPKGYFPVPALKFVRGPFLDFMQDILNNSSARGRGLYNQEYVNRLLAEPEQHHTRILGSKLWHLSVFELWLQTHVDSAG